MNMTMNMNPEVISMLENIMESASAASSATSLVGLLAYVFSSLAIYTIAQRREIGKAWMAWVPLLNLWILGSLSDQYRYVVKGEVKSKRKTLLILGIIKLIMGIAAVVMCIVAIVSAVSASMRGAGDYAVMEMLMGRLTVALLVMLPVWVLSVVQLVIELVALYDVYSSCEPANSVLYLVLSIVPGISRITQPLFLFLCRNKDEGMPPRREPVPEITEEF